MRYIAWVLEAKFNGSWTPSLLIFAGSIARQNHVADFAAENNLDIDEVRLRRIRQRATFLTILERFNPARYPATFQGLVAKRTLWSQKPEDGDSVQLDDGLFTKSGGQFLEVAV